jgi:hypothetical protein
LRFEVPVQTLLDYQETSCLYKLIALLDPEIEKRKRKKKRGDYL